jgi:carbon starvation protein
MGLAAGVDLDLGRSAAVLPIWRFALPINYVASYIVFLGLLFGIIGVFIAHPNFTLPAVTTFTIPISPIWPIMFVTIACGAISGWHSIVSSSGRWSPKSGQCGKL